MRWTVLIPAKALPAAKSRLAPMSSDAAAHRRLVEAIRTDTVAAAGAAPNVARVLLVVDVGGAEDADAPAGADAVRRIVQRRPGLNAAVREGAEHARRTWPEDGVAALVGDLPALRADELAAALELAAGSGEAFVPDSDGTGTTLLTATPGHRLDPEFGAGSAARHARHAAVLEAGPGLRHDVDTEADLQAAARDLHLGAATAAELDAVRLTARSTPTARIAE